MKKAGKTIRFTGLLLTRAICFSKLVFLTCKSNDALRRNTQSKAAI